MITILCAVLYVVSSALIYILAILAGSVDRSGSIRGMVGALLNEMSSFSEFLLLVGLLFFAPGMWIFKQILR